MWISGQVREKLGEEEEWRSWNKPKGFLFSDGYGRYPSWGRAFHEKEAKHISPSSASFCETPPPSKGSLKVMKSAPETEFAALLLACLLAFVCVGYVHV